MAYLVRYAADLLNRYPIIKMILNKTSVTKSTGPALTNPEESNTNPDECKDGAQSSTTTDDNIQQPGNTNTWTCTLPFRMKNPLRDTAVTSATTQAAYNSQSNDPAHPPLHEKHTEHSLLSSRNDEEPKKKDPESGSG